MHNDNIKIGDKLKIPYVIDNNNFKDRKTISLFKRFPFIAGVSNKMMEFKVELLNVKEGRVFYSMVDTPHATYNNEISVPAIKGITLSKYKKKKVNGGSYVDVLISEETILSPSEASMRQTTVKKLIGSFSSETPIKVVVSVELNSGYMRALIDTIQRGEIITPFGLCWCSCGGSSSPPPPPTNYTSIFEYMDVIVEYNNISGSGDKTFLHFKTNHNEFKEGAGTYKFSNEFEIVNDKNYSRIIFGLNSNFCADFSHYDTEWIPDHPVEGEFGPSPCQRIHLLGNLYKSTSEEIWDDSKGELFEEPDELENVTEETIANSQMYLDIDISKIINQISQVYSKKIFELQTDDEIDFLNYNIYVKKDEKKIYIIEEYLIGVGNEEWFENDRLRFKSKSSLGCLLIS